MNRLHSLLTRLLGIQRGFSRAVFHAFLIGTATAITLSAITVLVARTPIVASSSGDLQRPYDLANEFMGSVLFAPLTETLLLGVAVYFVRKLLKSPMAVCLVIAVMAGLLHAATRPLWFFSSAAGFFVLTFMYVTWHERSYAAAFWAACLPHMLNNTVSVLILWFLHVTEA